MKKIKWGIVVAVLLVTFLPFVQAKKNAPPAGFEEEVTGAPPAGFEEEIRIEPPAGFEEEITKKKAPFSPPAGFEKEIVTAPPAGFEKEIINKPPAEFEEEIISAPPAGFEEEIITEPPAGFEEEVTPAPPAGFEEEIEEIALEQAQAVIEEIPARETVAAPIYVPEPEEVDQRLKACRMAFPEADFDTSSDTDGDGLSDKTECYAYTHPLKADTDSDSCSDGNELNDLGTDPRNEKDCGRKESPEEKAATITDPQPGWILKKPAISGIVPNETASVTVMAFAPGPLEEEDEANAGPESILLGTVYDLPLTEIRGNSAKRFSMQQMELPRGTYDVVAVATLKNGSTVSSEPIRFSVDEEIVVKKPVPRSISNVPISEANGDHSSAFGPLRISGVRADLKETRGVEIEIDENRPTVTGDMEFGVQVFAVWESLVLTSSIIADSEAGEFSVQAPRALESDIGHRVTLYAVSQNDSGEKIRSENVNVFFRIQEPQPLWISLGWPALILLIPGLLLILLWRAHKKNLF